MPRSTQKTVLLIGVFLFCCAAIILAAVAYSTKYWITQTYYQPKDGNQTHIENPLILNAGLFKLQWENPLIGGVQDLSMKEAYNRYNDFMSFGLWVSTILFISLGMIFGVVTCVFAAVNSAMTPIEEITGVTGLYLWNGLACLFSLIAVLLWVAEYCSYLVHIAWSLKYVDNSVEIIITSHEPSYLGYSFYLMCGVAFLYMLNTGLVYLSTANLEKNKSQVNNMEEMTPDGMIMLY